MLRANIKLFTLVLLIGTAASGAFAADRWGAIALGGNGFGATRGRPDETSATSGALASARKAAVLENAVSA